MTVKKNLSHVEWCAPWDSRSWTWLVLLSPVSRRRSHSVWSGIDLKNIPRCSLGHAKFQIAVCLKTVNISILLRSLTHPDVLAAPFKTLVKTDFSCFHLRRKHFKSTLGKVLGRKVFFCKSQNVRDSRTSGYLWEDISRPSSHVSLKNSFTFSSGDVTYPKILESVTKMDWHFAVVVPQKISVRARIT